MNDLIIVEQFYGFAYVSAWGGGREADTVGGGERQSELYVFVYSEVKPTKGVGLTSENASRHKSPHGGGV